MNTGHRSSLSKPKPLWSLDKTKSPSGTKAALLHPTDVTFLQDDFLVVADSEGHRLPIFDIQGNLRTVLAADGVWPNGVATTAQGYVVVTDRMKNLVKIYDVGGQCIHAWGEKIIVGEDEIDLKPHGVAVDSHGRIIVTETLQSMIKIYSPDGKKITQFGGLGDSVGKLRLPFYVAVDRDDNIVVSDNMRYGIHIFSKDGVFLSQIGSSQDWGKRQFLCPYGVFVGQRGHVVVADHDNNRLVAYDENGTYIGDVVSKKDECTGPCGVAINNYGHLAFTENTHEYSNLKLLYSYDVHRESTDMGIPGEDQLRNPPK